MDETKEEILGYIKEAFKEMSFEDIDFIISELNDYKKHKHYWKEDKEYKNVEVEY